MNDTPRLIEHAFPLKQASLDSVHEKNVRHGHISTLHIWPARRPLAACRAALIAALLPDPGTPEKRKELCEKIGGKVVKKIEKKKMPNGQIVEREKEVTEGGILHWYGAPKNSREKAIIEKQKADLEWFRQEIRKAYGGRAPKVLDPFAGGGAIPLEAMRLGCEATAIDINPVAWFILKCTLEYPQKLAGKTHPLPAFILENEEFMEAFYKAHPHLVGRTRQTKKQKDQFAQDLFLKDKEDSGRAPKANLAWHVRAWGQWVLDHARRELAQYYPTYADFEPLDKHTPKPYEKQPMRLVPLKENGTPDINVLNAEFGEEYLADKRNPRWVAKPTVAYLWARTVKCKNCRSTVPLLKTRWFCKREKKRVLLTTEANTDRTGVVFGIEMGVPLKGGNTAQRREHDKHIGAGTMSRSGGKCPCCPTIMTMEDIRLEGQAGRLGAINTAVVAEGQNGKEYRLPTAHEIQMDEEAKKILPSGASSNVRIHKHEPFPVIFKRGKGSRVWDVDGNEYIDFLCGYGPIILGHREAEIDDAVCEQMKRGFCFNLCQPLQNQLAKKLRELIPCAEQSFLVKTGSNAATAAVRIARGYTARSKVIRCGYHGWHDWCVEVHGGVPEAVSRETLEFEYNDLESLDRTLSANKGSVAAIIMTPVGHPLAKPLVEPKPGFLEGVRRLADEHGAVLIFDEIRTGFRVSLGGAGAHYGVVPDMAIFGKAMANGYAIAAVCGKKSIMKVLADAQVFISSTYFPNSLEIAASLKTIEILEKERVCDKIWKKGEFFLSGLREVFKKFRQTGIRLSGIPPMPCITFDADQEKKYKERRRLFYTYAIRRGIFMQPFHHSYVAYRHTDEDLNNAISMISDSLADVAKEIP